MPQLRPELDAFLAAAYPGAVISEIGGDASARRYWRLALADGSTRVVMDYGSPFEGETNDLRLTRIFREAGLPVAEVLESLPGAGCLVVRDLGDDSLESLVLGLKGHPEARERIESLYERATDLVVALKARGTPVLRRSERASGPALDSERFRFEMDFFVEHYVRGIVGLDRPGRRLLEALHDLADRAAGGPRVFCHRDYHSRNLMVLPDGVLAMVDIQDARWGPSTYDLASLLRDAYVEMDEVLVDRMFERYRRQLPDPPPTSEIRARFDLVAVERMIKMLGTFGYQTHALGRTRYLDAMTRTLERLGRLLPLCAGAQGVFETLRETGLLTPSSPV